MSTLSLALEIPFDSKEEKIWSKLFEKYAKFGDIVITALTTIDIVRLPFINYSLIKYFSNLEELKKKNQQNIFNSLQSEFQTHIKQRISHELLDLQQTDQEQFNANLSKLLTKVSELQIMYPQEEYLVYISKFLNKVKEEIKELEENREKNEPDLEP